ncbi:MAG: hypothetical protein WBL80_03345 [Erysipelotrichaceae bacterium]
MKKEISLDEQINLIRRIMIDKMNLQGVAEGKVEERVINRLEKEIDILEAVIQTLKGLKNEETKVPLDDL